MATEHLLTSKPENLRWGRFLLNSRPCLRSIPETGLPSKRSPADPSSSPRMREHLLPDHEAFIASNKPILPGHIMAGPVAVRG